MEVAMKTTENDRKIRARLFTELVKELKVDPSQMTTAQWMDLYAELNRRMAATRSAEAAFGQDAARQEAEERIRVARVKKILTRQLPEGFVNPYLSDPRVAGVWTDNLSEAMSMSLSLLGEVDICYMAQITGKPMTEIIDSLAGKIYQNPEKWEECFWKGFETEDEYKSGNICRKLAIVQRANEYYDGYFSANALALSAVRPAWKKPEEIYVSLGSPWVPPYVIDQFICYILGGRLYSRMEPDYIPPEVRTSYDSYSATWYIPEKGRYGHSSRSCRVFGTARMEALHILEQTLNGKSVQVFDEVMSPGKENLARVINHQETVAASEKQQKMKQLFSEWVWRDPKRRDALLRIYNDRFSGYIPPVFDGSSLIFPWMDPSIQLYPFQKNAVLRMMRQKAVLLSHDVGSGKTYEMIAAACQLKYIGRLKKPIFVVPNNIVGQWESIFLSMKPDAKLAIVEPRIFTPLKRQATLKRLQEEEWDGIIMAYSCFDMLPLSYDCKRERLVRDINRLCEQMKRAGKVSAKVRNREKKMREALQNIDKEERQNPDLGVCFDQLGIDALYLDEAHNYKNVPIETKCDGLLGINRMGSLKCSDMHDRIHLILERGGHVVMATGTPITNSVSDVYIMQSYLCYRELERLGLSAFDAWTGMFAEKGSDFEIDVTTESYRMATRFSTFHNLPELSALLAQIADFHSSENREELPDFEGYQDEVIPRSPGLAAYLGTISSRADAVRSGLVDRATDNMLRITTDGRRAALDLRLVRPEEPFDPDSKVGVCAGRIYQIWQEGKEGKLTQLVFCDVSVPKNCFNLYDELRRLLVEKGIPDEEIAYIHSYDTDKKREALFDAVNKGEIRVLIGSTFKLGIGVNVQQRLVAVHHLDVPWRPADMIQREGRILRRGNQNDRVQIYRYITEGSFDAYSWQLLESKQRFICALLSGSAQKRDGAEVDSVILDYAEVKALAVGNPLLKKRVETANELYRMQALHRRYLETKHQMESKAVELPEHIQQLRDRISGALRDLALYQEEKEKEKSSPKAVGEILLTALAENVDQENERELMKYCGFAVVLPVGMKADKPAIWLVGSGRYYVEIGNSAVGAVSRMEHRLMTLTDVLIEFNRRLEEAEREQEDVKTFLSGEDNYAQEIVHLEERLRAIDRKIGRELDD
jgi:N12 class adenine-specific DNA methylase